MDKYRGITHLPLAKSKVEHLLGRLAANQAIGSFQTQEELTRAYADISARILQGYERRLYDLPKIVKGSPANEIVLNTLLLGIYNEMKYLLEAVRGTAEMAEENFNFAVSFIRKFQADLKISRQQLSNYSLYATQFDNTLHFGETFSTERNIDRGSSFLKEKECFIDLGEGTISLPRKENIDEWKIKKIEISGPSNGILGNNVEAGTPVRGSIKAMYDGNVDTWTEYERIVFEEDVLGLKLELKVTLDDVQIVNGIKVSPVLLGARTPVSLSTIDVSQDGREWISLKEDVRVASFLDEDPESRFHLSPSTSRSSGEFQITFAPRQVQFIRILLEQSSSFPITDTAGSRRFRYAIGIRELAFYGYQYEPAGELITNNIEFSKVISSVGMNALVDPPLLTANVGGAEHFISFDDGASWQAITTLDESSPDIPEILNPAEEITSLRYKVRLFKDELAFEETAQEVTPRPFREVRSWDQRRPFSVNLTHTPVEGTLSVCDPDVAVRGKLYPKKVIGRGVENSLQVETGSTYRRHGNIQHRVKVPLKAIKDLSTFYLYVNNGPWSRVASTGDFASQWAREYVLQKDSNGRNWEVVFGNNDATSPSGAIPGPTDEISVYLSEEYTTVDGLAPPYKIKLDYPSDGEKENTIIRFGGKVSGQQVKTMPAGLTKFDLGNENILVGETRGGITYQVGAGTYSRTGMESRTWSNNPSPPGTGVFREYKDFVNGKTELSSDGDWTVDAENGIVYTKDATDEEYRYTISYNYEDAKDLTSADWDFVEGSLDEIEVYESGYLTKTAQKTVAGSDIDKSSLNLVVSGDQIRGIVPKSTSFTYPVVQSYQPFEVPFIDGEQEFIAYASIQDESIPENLSGVDSIAKFRLTHWQNLVSDIAPFFDDERQTFVDEKASLASVSSQGDFFFDATGEEKDGAGYIYVHLGAAYNPIPSGLHVSYQYADEFKQEQNKGAFSIDATEGRIYFATPITRSGSTISFKYTPYTASYNIAQQLKEEQDFTISGQTIQILSGASGEAENSLSISYKYRPEVDSVGDLATYFSPLLRAIDIKVA